MTRFHVADVLAADAADEAVFNFAAAHARVIVSADTDFGDLLCALRDDEPSCCGATTSSRSAR